MENKIIFLDIDGVLTSHAHSKQLHDLRKKHKTKFEYDCAQIDKTKVVILNSIIEQTGAKVVISSSWRHSHSIGEMQLILNECGFIGEIVGSTSDLRTSANEFVRGAEIAKYIDNMFKGRGKERLNYRKYVIIDDDSYDMLLHQAPHFFHCDNEFGLTGTLAYRIVNYLNSFNQHEHPTL